MVCCLFPSRGRLVTTALAATLAASFLLLVGCGGTQSGSQTSSASSSSPSPSTPDESSDVTYEGSLSAEAAGGRSTRESLVAADGQSAAQLLPANLGSVSGIATFWDLQGNPLLGPNGTPYPPVPVGGAGAFTASNLPVGLDFVIAIDVDGDGEPDIVQIVQIPASEDGDQGELDGVIVDPLSTLVATKLQQLLADSGIDPEDLPFSFTAVVHRVVNAYIHLFEEAGIDGEVTLEDIAALDDRSLEELLERLVPASVRAGLEAAAGGMVLGNATEVEEVVRAAAEVFVCSGFPIADDPGGFDLSFLGDLPDVEVKSLDEFMPNDEFGQDGPMMPPDPETEPPAGQSIDGDRPIVGDGQSPDSGPYDGQMYDHEPPTIYVSTVTEPDRNFASDQDFDEDYEQHHLPMLNEHLLASMAELHLQGRVITLGNLYRLLTDHQVGLGARLTYGVFTPEHEGPPPMIFETADGEGTARDIELLMHEMMLAGLFGPAANFDDLQAQEAQLRELMSEWLEGTVPPTFQRLFGNVVSERIESVEQLFGFIREARAHLPFSRSGPSTFFVMADGNTFDSENTETVNAVTVDIEFDNSGLPARVSYDPSHGGGYYLGFTHDTNEGHSVEPIVIETGRWLHGPHGRPIVLNMDDENLFAPIDGRPFIDFVSEAGTFYPGIPVPVYDSAARFDEPSHEPETDSTAGEPMPGSSHLYVLATEPGPNGVPVRVDYNVGDGTFSYRPDGRYYVIFLPESEEQGVFGLYDANLNFMPTAHDLTAEGFIDTLPPPPDGDRPPPDGDRPPPDGDRPPPDGEQPPPDGDQPPPDGDQQPPDGEQPAPEEPATEPSDPVETDLRQQATDEGDQPPPADGTAPEPVDDQPLPDDGTQPWPGDESPPPDDGTWSGDEPPMPDDGTWSGDESPPHNAEPARVTLDQIIGLDVRAEYFEFVYGTEAPNPNHNPDGNPYLDDANGNGVEDPDESTFDYRPVLHDPNDWRSTDVERYYRRADGGGVTFEDLDFDSPDPRTRDGEVLVPRNLLPRLNAFAYGRPNSAINMLTTSMPPEFLDGRHGLTEDTELGIFQAMAMINLAMEQMFTVEARIDVDGDGPQEEASMLVDAHLFVLPIGDPFVLLLEGFNQLSTSGVRD